MLSDWLVDNHPDVCRLDQLDRNRHIEPFLARARTRPWRGANGAGKTVGFRPREPGRLVSLHARGRKETT